MISTNTLSCRLKTVPRVSTCLCGLFITQTLGQRILTVILVSSPRLAAPCKSRHKHGPSGSSPRTMHHQRPTSAQECRDRRSPRPHRSSAAEPLEEQPFWSSFSLTQKRGPPLDRPVPGTFFGWYRGGHAHTVKHQGPISLSTFLIIFSRFSSL